ncbi:MAG: GTP cyclohydrolase II [Pseudolabrys sp.]|nr:GTP cyclohydrolase II [Pseudolabrys sp.]
MSSVGAAAASALFGPEGYLGVSRGIAEFRALRPVVLAGPDERVLTLPVEGLDARRLNEFLALCAPKAPCLVITARRARVLGMDTTAPMALNLPQRIEAPAILALAAEAECAGAPPAQRAGDTAAAALRLAKLAHVLPAVLASGGAHAEEGMRAPPLISVDALAVDRFVNDAIRSLTLASEASVPLNSGTRTRFVVFRDALGGSPVAIIVGAPDLARPVPVRLHSACLTGDVFGSRRCDCGDQLRLAVARLEGMGGGIILYLAQEGRDLGLANKMRAYRLQDEGLDTVDANTALGFDDDERDYGVAARMLQMLGCTRIVLLTNNPAKLEGLTKAGIEIVSRVPLVTPINADNLRYLAAKAARAGHRLDHIMASLGDPS